MFMKDISAISRYWYGYTHRNLRTIDIAGSEHSIVMVLARNECMNQDGLSAFLSLDKGTIAKALTKLERKNLVMRVVNEENRREKIVSLTENGKEEVGRIFEVSETWKQEVLEGVSEEDQEVFFRTLVRVAQKAKLLSHSDMEKDVHENR
ncbi:MarR family transcriptional regulator [Sphaerochaeta sp. PS]|uniref:MarR family winged helix-turn-helix transcriptional regulator n=1 Tax=Sphaerochaeta sp. PS TaxID=3076336 RepID=UPI0028A54570|nr:MarR family transcriptional regulator [Sphaerochaeta sp. PS]MDT4761138.1 MarR family transcriptional regulator [Sphaerochaeta sp. PS]